MRLSRTRHGPEGERGATDKTPVDWIARIEGPMQGPIDAFHWLRVYDEMTRTLEQVVLSGGGPQAERRLAQARERRAYWARQLDGGGADTGAGGEEAGTG